MFLPENLTVFKEITFLLDKESTFFANSTFDTRKFVLGSCILIYTEQFICFLLLNFRLIYPVSSRWPSRLIPALPPQ